MKNTSVLCGLALMSCVAAHGQVGAQSATAQRAFLNQTCAYCHNDKLKSGGMSLTTLDLEHLDRSGELAEKVIRKVRVGLMPPPGMPRPNAAAIHTFVSSLENSVDQTAATHPHAGRPALHRLNRTEYANSIRDLLGVQVDVSAMLPPDDMSHGFDNMADVLTVSPTLLEAYIRAASRISREAIGDPQAQALTKTYSIPRVVAQTRHVDGTPFGTRGGLSVVHNFPADGEYVFKIGFYYAPTGPLYGTNQGKGQQVEIAINGEKVAVVDVNPALTLARDGMKTPPITVKAGAQRISASFIQKFDGPIEDEYRMVEQTLVDTSVGAVPGMTTVPHLHEFSVTGPLHITGISDSDSRRRVFTCHPPEGGDEIPCAREIISNLAQRAFRRPVVAADMEGLLGFYQSGRNEEGTFDAGIRTAIQAIIASPNFVFRFEKAPTGIAAGENYRITDLELASRLSYFLWSSGPDSQLLALGAQNKLHEPATLEKEVRRMLADARSESLSIHFADQWLHLQNLREANPDLFLFPNFDRTLADAMRRETELLFDNIMRQNRSIVEMLTADYTFVNERLALHYGIPNVMGERFRRVPVTDENRIGILGHGSMLTLTSTAIRTSPVHRGQYVMEVLLGTPPPPAPPNVPALPENAELRTGHVAKPLSVRERMEQHRADPVCASCHKLMDPIGFSLENFDAVGVWRTNDSGFKVDPTGQMFDGAKLNGPTSLRQALLSHTDSYIQAFTENLLAYGLGRVIDYHDEPAVRAIDRDAAKTGNQFDSFILGIVRSMPFQMRRAEEPGSEPTTIIAAAPGQAPAARSGDKADVVHH
jgi:Protein of unknown function (DUF1592)/Protein of unknown function (DUF1588)/Protein of unknown function (DUF1587)/Protein of unknown function (DUF1595)/Protein of unknown function (DUF1585)